MHSLPLHTKWKREIWWHGSFSPGLSAKFNWVIEYRLSSLINYWILIEYQLFESTLLGLWETWRLVRPGSHLHRAYITVSLIIHITFWKICCEQLTKLFFLLCVSLPRKKWKLAAQSCPTLWDPMDGSLPSSAVHGVLHFLLQGLSPNQGSNPGLMDCKSGSLPTEPLGKSRKSDW